MGQSADVCLIFTNFFNGFKAPRVIAGAIDAGGIINDCPAPIDLELFEI